MSSLEVHRCQERAPPEVVSELAAALVQEAVEKGGPRGVRAGCAWVGTQLVFLAFN